MLHATPQERLALGVIGLLLAAGAGVRLLGTGPSAAEWQQFGREASDTSGGEAVAAVRGAAEVELARSRIRTTPLAKGERIDPNRASADELDRLPRVGPALAVRIVEWREANGSFRSLADLDSVSGVGPKLLSEIAPFVDLPPAGAFRSTTIAEPRLPLDLNRATAAELDALPGIGPVLAARIVTWRETGGEFRSTEDLERVPGIGAALRERLAPMVRVGP